MAKYKANNTTTSPWEAFYYRGVYKREALEGIGNSPEVRDFSFAEDVLYGRVDTRLNTVYPKEDAMKIIIPENNAETSYRLLNFASDAFVAVKGAMNAARENNTIPSDEPIFSKFDIKRAYKSPIDLYNIYIINLMDKYVSNYLINKNMKKQVINFVQFMNHFINFLKQQPGHNPFTFTSWQRSTKSNIFTSGIAIDIGGLEFGKDPLIEERVLNSIGFRHYLKVCRANGFSVSQLAPTLMVADILSPGLLPYAMANHLYTTEDIFLRQYNYAYMADYNFMQSNLIDGYNLFATRFPIEKIVTSKCPKIISSVIKQRDLVSPSQMQQNISMSEWLSFYSKVRNVEEQGSLDKQAMEQLLKKIKITKYLDIKQVMRYINNTFRSTYKSKYGGLNYFINKNIKTNKKAASPVEASSGTSKVNNGGPSGAD
jgi:hypothetical protein